MTFYNNIFLIHKKKIIAIFILCIVIVIIAVCISYFSHKDIPLQFEEENTQNVNMFFESDEFIYRPGNFAFIKSPGWKSISIDNLNKPREFADVIYFALQKEGTSCVFAYTSYKNLGNANDYSYKQAAFGFRTWNYSDQQFDADWYAPRENFPEGTGFNWDGHNHLPGEILRIPSPDSPYADYPTVKTFVLFSTDNDFLPKECVFDAESMVRQSKPYFEEDSLNKNSEGIIFFYRNYGSKDKILFVSKDEQVAKVLIEKQIDGPHVYDNNFYYQEGSKIKTFDVFSKEDKDVVDFGINADDVVVNFYIHKDIIYALVGSDCREYMAHCDLSLYEYSIKEEIKNRLADNVTHRVIEFVDLLENKIYMSDTFGDAGIVIVHTGWYDYALNVVSPGQTFSAEYDDSEVEPQGMIDLRNFRARFVEQNSKHDHAVVKNGKLEAPKEDLGYVKSDTVIFSF